MTYKQWMISSWVICAIIWLIYIPTIFYFKYKQQEQIEIIKTQIEMFQERLSDMNDHTNLHWAEDYRKI